MHSARIGLRKPVPMEPSPRGLLLVLVNEASVADLAYDVDDIGL